MPLSLHLEGEGLCGRSERVLTLASPVPAFANPPAAQLKELLSSCKTIAIVGCSPHAYRMSHQIAAAMQRRGYRVIPVHPSGELILGERAYTDLSQVPEHEKVDIVTVFRRADVTPEIAHHAIRLRARALWLQHGIVNHEAAAIAHAGGLECVMNACMSVTYSLVV